MPSDELDDLSKSFHPLNHKWLHRWLSNSKVQSCCLNKNSLTQHSHSQIDSLLSCSGTNMCVIGELIWLKISLSPFCQLNLDQACFSALFHCAGARAGMSAQNQSKSQKEQWKSTGMMTAYICTPQEGMHAAQLRQKGTAVRFLKKDNYLHYTSLYCWKKQRSFQAHCCFSRLGKAQDRTKLLIM